MELRPRVDMHPTLPVETLIDALLMGPLTFAESHMAMTSLFDERQGILVSSLRKGLPGYFILNRTLPAESYGNTIAPGDGNA